MSPSEQRPAVRGLTRYMAGLVFDPVNGHGIDADVPTPVYLASAVDALFVGATLTAGLQGCRIQELEAERDELQRLFDAFTEGQAASIDGKPRESNPYPPSDTFAIGPLWLQWDDGYDCHSNRVLKAALAEAEHWQTDHALLCDDYRQLMMDSDKLRAALADRAQEIERLTEYCDHYEKHIIAIADAVGVRLNGSEQQWSEATREILKALTARAEAAEAHLAEAHRERGDV